MGAGRVIRQPAQSRYNEHTCRHRRSRMGLPAAAASAGWKAASAPSRNDEPCGYRSGRRNSAISVAHCGAGWSPSPMPGRIHVRALHRAARRDRCQPVDRDGGGLVRQCARGDDQRSLQDRVRPRAGHAEGLGRRRRTRARHPVHASPPHYHGFLVVGGAARRTTTRADTPLSRSSAGSSPHEHTRGRIGTSSFVTMVGGFRQSRRTCHRRAPDRDS